MTAYPKGEILQIASPTEMYRSPVSKFAASFLGSCGISVVVIILLASSAAKSADLEAFGGRRAG